MKIILIDKNYKTTDLSNTDTASPILYMKPDTALLTADKKRFYIPDYTSDIRCQLHFVVRIDKVGKNIAERFAHRYYSQVALGIDITAQDILNDCLKNNRPWEIAKSIDNSTVLGTLLDKNLINIEDLDMSLKKNNKTLTNFTTKELLKTTDQLIEYISQFFTLKTGDLIFTASPFLSKKLEIGDLIEAYLEKEKYLELEIC